MPSLAHEGNPKEDEITITAGDVLSTASLDINILTWGGAPDEVPPNDPPNNVSSSCSDTMLFAEGGYPGVPMAYNDGQSSGSLTVWTDQGGLAGGVAPVSTWLNVSFETGTACCAMAYAQIHMIDIPTISYVQHGTAANPDFRSQAIYPVHDIELGVIVQGVSDNPYFGICTFVEDGSTVNDFTGYVLAIDMGHDIAKLMKYVHQSLCSDGQILATRTGDFSAVDFIWIAVYTDPNSSSDGDTIWEIETDIEDANGDDIVTPISYQVHDSLMDVVYTNVTTDANNIVSQAGDRHNRANVGVVAIGGSDLSGIAILGADATHYGIRASCDSFCFSRGEVS